MRPWIAAVALAACSRPAQAPERGCSGDPKFDRRSVVRLSTPMPEPAFHYELDTAGIEALRPTPPGQARIPGLTVAHYALKKEFETSVAPQRGGRGVCVAVDSLDIAFAYSAFDVYVSRDYPEASCARLQIREHELGHVEVHRRLHQRYASLMVETLASAPALPTRANPAAVEDVEAGRRLVDKVVAQTADPLFARFEEELTREQARLDTPESYRSLRDLCPDWRY